MDTLPKSSTVLVVEDDVDIRETVRMLLEDEGYQVLEAPNGVLGLQVLQQSARALVVLIDYMMPQMSGIEMLAAIAQHHQVARQHAYVLVSANYDRLPPGGSELLTALSVRTVKKPFDVNALLAVVARAREQLHAASA